MLLQAAAPPACGSYVEICCRGHTIVARVVWTKDRRFGVHTRETIDLRAILGEVASTVSPLTNRISRISPLTPKPERRSIAEVNQRFERSRQLSSAFEFGTLIVCSVGAALTAVSILYRYLTATFESVGTHL